MIPNPADSAQLTPVTNLRNKIFAFILKELDRWQRLPSQDDVRWLFGGLTDDVDTHLKQLEREGLLLLDKNGNDSLRLVPTFISAPGIGPLAKVADCLARTDEKRFGGSIGIDLRNVEIPVGCGISVVQIFDDRMIDAEIQRGDIALVVHTQPMRGNIVAVEEGDVLVLRRYLIISGIPHFLAENAATPDLRLGTDVPMHGVLWGLIRTGCCRSSGHTLSKVNWAPSWQTASSQRRTPAKFRTTASKRKENCEADAS